LARLHNDANVVAIGARMHSLSDATRLVEVFLTTEFSGEARHSRRIAMLRRYEETGQVPSSDA
jgi:ribose 5-phosphate isomerase B